MKALRRAALLAYRAGRSWVDHRASTMGASIAFYTLFSMGPVLLITLWIVGSFYDHDAARHELLLQVKDVLGTGAAAQVQAVIESVGAKQDSSHMTLQVAIGIVTSLFAATTVFAELKDSLDIIWESPKPQGASLWSVVRRRVLSFGIVMSLGFVLLTLMIVSAAVSALVSRYAEFLGNISIVAEVFNNVVALLVTALLFGAIFKVLPDRHVPWHVIWQSALLTALLYMIGKGLIAMYLGTTALASSYGAAGAVVLILVWVYYSSQVFLYGAELARQIEIAWEREHPSEAAACKVLQLKT